MQSHPNGCTWCGLLAQCLVLSTAQELEKKLLALTKDYEGAKQSLSNDSKDISGMKDEIEALKRSLVCFAQIVYCQRKVLQLTS